MANLDNELIDRILQQLHLERDLTSLAHCSRVNSLFSRLVGRWLYSHVDLCPSDTLDLRDKDGLKTSANLISAVLPQNCPHVLTLTVGGYVPAKPMAMNPIGSRLCNAIPTFPNLKSIVVDPRTCHTEILYCLMDKILLCSNLTELSVNALCMSEEVVTALTLITKLRKLTLRDPTRILLNGLISWISRLPEIVQLNLQGNCGSITAMGVLRPLTKVLNNQLWRFSLGLSYSLIHEDTFVFFNHFEYLRTLDILYYAQRAIPSSRVYLPRLEVLSMVYTRAARVVAIEEADRLHTYIRALVAATRTLTEIRITFEEAGEDPRSGPNVSFDGLADHLSLGHGKTLRCVYMPSMFIGFRSFKRMVIECCALERLGLAVDVRALNNFSSIPRASKDLRMVEFDVRNVKRRRLQAMLDDSKVRQVFAMGVRDYLVNGMHWKGSWRATATREVELHVERKDRICKTD